MEVPAQTDLPAAMALSVPASEVSSAIAAAKADAELYGADVAAHPAVELSTTTITTTTAEKLPEVPSPSPSSGAGIPGLFLLGGPAAEAEADPMALDVQSLASETVQPAADDVEDSKFTVHDFLFAVETPPAPAVEPHVAEEPAPPEPEPAALDTDMAEPAQKDPVDPAFLAAGEANKADETAEWQLDSSSDSSSSTDSSDSSSDDADADADDDDDYPLMDHAQLAKLLMREDGDDDSAHKEGLQGPLKTKNELPDIAPPSVPDIVVTAAMPLSLLGTIEAIVDTLVLIKASVSGAHQVLNEGSLLVLEDRSIFGVVADTLGRVEAPLYTVRFAAPADIPAPVGTDVFYVPQHSDYVFTQALHRLKGSDASNIFDEEVADGEREFSDDEAEAEHKRQRKYARQGQSGSKGNGGGGGGGRGAPSRPETEDLYTPLARPSNLAELMSGPPPNGGGGGGGGGGGNRERGGHGRGRGRNRARGQRPARGRDNHDFRKRDREAPYQPRPDSQQQNYPQQQQQQYQPYPPQQQQYPQQQQQYSPQQYPPQQQQWSPPIPPQFPPYQQQQQQNFYHSGPAPQFPPALPQGAHVNPAFLPPPGRNDFTWTPPVPQGLQGVGDTEAALKALQSLVSLRNQMQQPQG